jgi:hypothetical protein
MSGNCEQMVVLTNRVVCCTVMLRTAELVALLGLVVYGFDQTYDIVMVL